MSLNQSFIAELKMEAANTRRILERVPVDQNEWAPHEKSMKLGRLATHVAELSGWITMTMMTNELDLTKLEVKSHMPLSNEELLNQHDENVAQAISVLEHATEEDLNKMWTMRKGEQTYFTLPKKAVLRTWAFNHTFHHRGQLSVYLRLLDIPVPGLYGPSADERPAAAVVEVQASVN